MSRRRLFITIPPELHGPRMAFNSQLVPSIPAHKAQRSSRVAPFTPSNTINQGATTSTSTSSTQSRVEQKARYTIEELENNFSNLLIQFITRQAPEDEAQLVKMLNSNPHLASFFDRVFLAKVAGKKIELLSPKVFSIDHPAFFTLLTMMIEAQKLEKQGKIVSVLNTILSDPILFSAFAQCNVNNKHEVILLKFRNDHQQFFRGSSIHIPFLSFSNIPMHKFGLFIPSIEYKPSSISDKDDNRHTPELIQTYYKLLLQKSPDPLKLNTLSQQITTELLSQPLRYIEGCQRLLVAKVTDQTQAKALLNLALLFNKILEIKQEILEKNLKHKKNEREDILYQTCLLLEDQPLDYIQKCQQNLHAEIAKIKDKDEAKSLYDRTLFFNRLLEFRLKILDEDLQQEQKKQKDIKDKIDPFLKGRPSGTI